MLYRAVLAMLLIALVNSIAPGQDRTRSLGDVVLDLNRLKTLGEQRYNFQASKPSGNTIAITGTFTFATEVQRDKVVLRDKIELTHQEMKLSLTLVHHCKKNNYLTPERIESKGAGGEFSTFVATIVNGKAAVKINGRENTIEVPPDTVSYSALVRLLPLLPREKGLRISFPHWLESSELHLKKDFVIECLGEEQITRGTQKWRCTKYRLTSSQIMPMDAWIDSDNILQRLLIDERKVLDLIQE